MLLAILSLHSLHCVILLKIRMAFVMMGRVEVQVFRWDITECSGSKGGGTHWRNLSDKQR